MKKLLLLFMALTLSVTMSVAQTQKAQSVKPAVAVEKKHCGDCEKKAAATTCQKDAACDKAAGECKKAAGCDKAAGECKKDAGCDKA